MAALARLYTFVAGANVVASQHNEELDQIIGLLNGTTLKEVLLKSASAGTATLGVDVTGGGKVAQFFVAGVEKSRVNAAGQFESAHATGTAPIVVASTTKVTNLNADLLDGFDEAVFLRATDPVILAGADTFAEVTFTQAAGDVKVENNATHLTVKNGAQSLLSVAKLGATPAVQVYGVLKGITPVADEDLTTKLWVEGEVDAVAVETLEAAATVSGLTGGTDGRAVRWSVGSTVCTDANNSDALESLSVLLFKAGGLYYRAGQVVPLTVTNGAQYFLGASGSPFTVTAPVTAGLKYVSLGRAIGTTNFYFAPTTPYVVV